MECLRMHLDVTIKEGGIVKQETTEVAKKGRVIEISNKSELGTSHSLLLGTRLAYDDYRDTMSS